MTVPASFDLVSEPWIPCVRLDGSTDELGLLDTLAQAHELREVVDASPLVTASLHRLLLAILHRNLGPRNYDAWRELWEAEQFDAQVLTAYFDKWRHRFDLFDEERPFYQVAGMEGVTYHPLSVFAEELASGNNAALFAHNADDRPAPFSPARAAGLVLAMQVYDLSGTRTNPAGPGSAKADAGPLALGYTFMPVGDSVFQTLLLNMITHDPIANDQIGRNPGDVPAWERDTPPRLSKRTPEGYVDYMTWQARLLHLRPERTGHGDVEVRSAVRAAGESFPTPSGEADPMISYVQNTKPRPGQLPYSPYKGSVGRSLWRDSIVLLRDVEGLSRRPAVLGHVAHATEEAGLRKSARARLWAIGLVRGSQAAKVEYWRHERLPLPLRYLAEDELVDELGYCLQEVEEVATALRRHGLARLARELRFPGKHPKDLSKKDKETVTELSAALLGEGQDAAKDRNRTGTDVFWSRLELPFRELVRDLASEDADRQALVDRWVLLVARTAREALRETINRLQPTARNLRAACAAEGSLNRCLRKITEPHREEVTASEG